MVSQKLIPRRWRCCVVTGRDKMRLRSSAREQVRYTSLVITHDSLANRHCKIIYISTSASNMRKRKWRRERSWEHRKLCTSSAEKGPGKSERSPYVVTGGGPNCLQQMFHSNGDPVLKHGSFFDSGLGQHDIRCRSSTACKSRRVSLSTSASINLSGAWRDHKVPCKFSSLTAPQLDSPWHWMSMRFLSARILKQMALGHQSWLYL